MLQCEFNLKPYKFFQFDTRRNLRAMDPLVFHNFLEHFPSMLVVSKPIRFLENLNREQLIRYYIDSYSDVLYMHFSESWNV